MTRRPLVCLLIAFVLFICPIAHALASDDAASKPDIRVMLGRFASLSPDPCGPPNGNEKDWPTDQLEKPLFESAAALVVDALNSGSAPPKERAAEALRGIERISAEVNAAWPRESRFQFEILDLQDVLAVKMSVRAYERFFVFGIPTGEPDKPNRVWRQIGLIENDSDFDVPWVDVQLYPLRRGPSGKARFLARSTMGGCAGSFGVSYDALEWNPENGGTAERIIAVNGALGLDDEVKGFPPTDKLRTDGTIIALPYCWWSAIDTWDNPSMCAVDEYDISGDEVRFISRRVNRPDLLPIARAAEYAEKRDFPAVRAYCMSDAVARQLVASAPHRFFEVEVKVKQLGAGREMVYEETDSYRFVVEKRGDRWLIARFDVN